MTDAQEPTAARFLERLETLASPVEREKLQRSFAPREGDVVIGVRMGEVFALAKEFIDMPPTEIERLLESPVHEARAGAMSVMDKQARRKRTSAERRSELFALYLRRHDRIDDWDLVDLGALHVVGGYLANRPRDVLYELARSPNPWERRTAIYSTLFFVRQGDGDDTGDTFAIAGILVHDEHDLVQKATGGMLREAGRRDEARLREFLDRHAATMPRVMLRQAIERLGPEERDHYRGMAKAVPPA